MATVTKIPATVSRYTATPIQTRVRRKVAAYARVSTDHEDQLNSYEAQCDYYTTYIQANDEWEFAGVYSDEGISGTSTRRRDGFNRMVEDALAGRIGLILTKSVSRFARNTVDSLTTIRKLKEHGTEVYFEKENIWTFDRVQAMIEQRSRVRHFSGATIFSTKIRCGECGGWFGSKVWHPTDQYRRVIWRCNAKYGGKTVGCKTPHVTEEEVKAAFVRVVNKLIGNRAMLLADLREIQQTYSGTDELSQHLHELDERLNAEAEAVQGLIAQNARVAQNQDDYNAAYDAAVSRYEATKAEREKVAADIRQRGIRRREFERFITELEKLPEAVSEFDDALWGGLVKYVTVGKDKTMVFTLIGGTEMKA